MKQNNGVDAFKIKAARLVEQIFDTNGRGGYHSAVHNMVGNAVNAEVKTMKPPAKVVAMVKKAQEFRKRMREIEKAVEKLGWSYSDYNNEITVTGCSPIREMLAKKHTDRLLGIRRTLLAKVYDCTTTSQIKAVLAEADAYKVTLGY